MLKGDLWGHGKNYWRLRWKCETAKSIGVRAGDVGPRC